MDRDGPTRRWVFVALGAAVMGAAGTYQFVWSSLSATVGARIPASQTALGTVFTLFVVAQTLVQDYAFLETLVGTVGHALGDAPTMEAKSRLADFLGTLTAEENDYFERSFEALGVPEGTDAAPELAPTTRAFEDLLRRAAHEGGYAETLAVLVPVEWVYLDWATAVDGGSQSRFYLAEWIDLHATDEFAALVAWLRGELDEAGAAATPRRRRPLDRLFRRTVTLEVDFFEMAYEPDASAPRQGGDREW